MELWEFTKLYQINVSDKVEKKNWLSYLSWSYAWAEFKKIYPKATYEIKMFDNKPYIYDENLWYMVFTSVTVEWLTHDMRLPVMDWANKAMKDHEYTYRVKDWQTKKMVEKTVQPATMFDVNKTIMRCLVKNLAMFGLGLYIYNWEDLPEDTTEKEAPYTKPIFWWKNFEKLTREKDKYSFDEVRETVHTTYSIDSEYEWKIMELYWKEAKDLFK